MSSATILAAVVLIAIIVFVFLALSLPQSLKSVERKLEHVCKERGFSLVKFWNISTGIIPESIYIPYALAVFSEKYAFNYLDNAGNERYGEVLFNGGALVEINFK